MSVLEWALAMVVAIEFGLGAALASGAGAYIAAMLLTFPWQAGLTDLARSV